jgi:hypothetical protein
MNKYILITVGAMLLFEGTVRGGVGSHNTMYVGGTVTTIKQGAEGKISTADDKAFTFTQKRVTLAIPYEKVNALEYGQKAGRRLGLAIVLSPIALLSKKRKHFLTISYLDENDKQQAAVFELGKGIVRTTLASVQARSGRKIEFQDEEARKAGAN